MKEFAMAVGQFLGLGAILIPASLAVAYALGWMIQLF